MKTQQNPAYKEAFGYICGFGDGNTQDALFKALEEINKDQKNPIRRDTDWIDIPERECLIQKALVFDHEVTPEVYKEVVEKTLLARLLGQVNSKSLSSLSIEMEQRQIFNLKECGMGASLFVDKDGPRMKVTPIEN